MDRARFWTIVDKTLRASQGSVEDQAGSLHEALLTLSPQEIVAFDAIFAELALAAFRTDIHAALCIVVEDSSMPGFVEFLGWLVTRGKSVYENVLRDPDSLADVDLIADSTLGSGFVYIAMQAWEDKTGNSSLDFPATTEFPAEPVGSPLSNAEVRAKLPRMWKRFRSAS